MSLKIIDYFLSENLQNARLDIYTVAGKLIESIPLLPAPYLLHSLLSGDGVMYTKQMMLTKASFQVAPFSPHLLISVSPPSRLRSCP